MRILLKLSGEVLSGNSSQNFDPQTLISICREIKDALDQSDLSLGIVIGGGNILRGKMTDLPGLSRVNADYMGMLGTIINSLALQAALDDAGAPARVLSALPVAKVVEPLINARALKHLDHRRVVIFAAGSGNPFFTTDSAAALHALSINADLLLKATKVDGIYDKDPVKFSDAEFFSSISYEEVIKRQLRIMDLTAFTMCAENKLPIQVMNIHKNGNLKKALLGQKIGSIVGE